MPLPTWDDEPTPTLAWLVRSRRGHDSLRALSQRCGVSAGQLSRIENGESQKPGIETLMALAPALNYHPTVLLVMAGHLGGSRARQELRRIVEQAQLDPEDFGPEAEPELLAAIEGAMSDARLRDAALWVAMVPVNEVDFPDTLRRIAALEVPDEDLLQEIVSLWSSISPDRRWRLVELARDLQKASRSPLNSKG